MYAPATVIVLCSCAQHLTSTSPLGISLAACLCLGKPAKAKYQGLPLMDVKSYRIVLLLVILVSSDPSRGAANEYSYYMLHVICY